MAHGHVFPPAAAEHCNFTTLAMVEGNSPMCTNSGACSPNQCTPKRGDSTAMEFSKHCQPKKRSDTLITGGCLLVFAAIHRRCSLIGRGGDLDVTVPPLHPIKECLLLKKIQGVSIKQGCTDMILVNAPMLDLIPGQAQT